jgi:hypothetical protein
VLSTRFPEQRSLRHWHDMVSEWQRHLGGQSVSVVLVDSSLDVSEAWRRWRLGWRRINMVLRGKSKKFARHAEIQARKLCVTKN